MAWSNDLFGSWEEFTYGKTCTLVKSAKRNLRRLITASALAISLVGGTPVDSSAEALEIPLASHENLVVPRIRAPSFMEDSGLRAGFSEARLFLGLTQEETAKILNVSASTIEKFEQGQTVAPQEFTREKYLAFVELHELYRSRYSTRKWAIRRYLKSPRSIYDGRSAFEFASSRGDNGIFEILGIEKQQLT